MCIKICMVFRERKRVCIHILKVIHKPSCCPLRPQKDAWKV